MRKTDVIKHFGTQTQVAKFIDKTPQLINRWPDPIPPKWALYLDWATELEFDKAIYQPGTSEA